MRRLRATTVSKVVTLLEAVAASPDGVGVREAARRSEIDKSAVSRLLTQLETLDLVTKSELSGRYHVGPRFMTLALTVQRQGSLWQVAAPVLQTLSRRFNETCYLTVRDRESVVFREKVDGDRTIRYVIELGQVSPLNAGAGGRAILAGLPEDELDRVLAMTTFSAITPQTITSSRELRRRARADRRRGYSMSMSERVVGGVGIAAPYYGQDGECIGSIALTVPEQRYDPSQLDEIGAAVVAAANELSHRLDARSERDH